MAPVPLLRQARKLDEISHEQLRKAQAGDPVAQRLWVEIYQQRVFAFVGRMLGRKDAALVEDLCQECFLRALRALPRFDPSGPARLSTWLLTIATRLCLDHVRRVIARPELVGDDARSAVSPVAEHRVMLARVATALATLSPDLRATLLLRTVGELSVAEAAGAMGVDEGTVKSRLSRARDQLREALGEPT